MESYTRMIIADFTMTTSILMITTVVMAMCVSAVQSGCVPANITVMENLNLSMIMGPWHEIYWKRPYFNNPKKDIYDCVEVWSLSTDIHKVIVDRYGRAANHTECGTYATLSYDWNDVEGPAKWGTLKIINSTSTAPKPAWIIATNYVSYAVQYGCEILDPETEECISNHAWVWSRTEQLSSEDMATVKTILPSLCLEIGDFEKMPITQECPRRP